MLARERQHAIMDLLRSKGAVTTSGLVERFDVSTETVRRDLAELEAGGQIIKVHGGAVLKTGMEPNLGLNQRSQRQNKQKRAIAMKALECLHDGDVIAIDTGSTGSCFAEALATLQIKLTVVTCSLRVFEALKEATQFKVILCGGKFMPEEQVFLGDLTLEMLRRLHVQKLFLTPSAVSMEFGICDHEGELVSVQRQMIHLADEVFVLADSSKFEKQALIRINDMNKQFHYITDDGLGDELIQLYENNGYHVILG